MDERKCPVCAAVVMGHPSKVYCSLACRGAAHASRAAAKYLRDKEAGKKYAPAPKDRRPCQHCATLFDYHPKMRVKFCSRPCALASRALASRAKEPSGSTPIPWAECCCGVWFIARSGRKNCSGQCYRQRFNAARRAAYRPELREPKSAVCKECGCVFESVYSTKTYCSTRCAKREGRRRVKARRRSRKTGAYVADVWRLRIYERDHWTCQLCHKRVKRKAVVPHPRAPTLDHIVPLAKGGTHEPANAQLACFICNSWKGDTALAQGEQLRLLG